MIVMVLLRLFSMRILYGEASHATVTVRAGGRAPAGRGETPRSETGANRVTANANALASNSPKAIMLTEGALLLVTGYPPLLTGRRKKVKIPPPAPCRCSETSVEFFGAWRMPRMGQVAELSGQACSAQILWGPSARGRTGRLNVLLIMTDE